MRVYKVMRRSAKNRMISIAAPMHDFMGSRSYGVEYEEGKVAHAQKGTGLFVFKQLADAKAFVSSELLPDPDIEIWEVECGDFLVERKFIATPFSQHIDRFWKKVDTGFITAGSYGTRAAPKGTYTCRWVKPIKRVWKRGKGQDASHAVRGRGRDE